MTQQLSTDESDAVVPGSSKWKTGMHCSSFACIYDGMPLE